MGATDMRQGLRVVGAKEVRKKVEWQAGRGSVVRCRRNVAEGPHGKAQLSPTGFF
jgi:hypothetical protein